MTAGNGEEPAPLRTQKDIQEEGKRVIKAAFEVFDELYTCSHVQDVEAESFNTIMEAIDECYTLAQAYYELCAKFDFPTEAECRWDLEFDDLWRRVTFTVTEYISMNHQLLSKAHKTEEGKMRMLDCIYTVLQLCKYNSHRGSLFKLQSHEIKKPSDIPYVVEHGLVRSRRPFSEMTLKDLLSSTLQLDFAWLRIPHSDDIQYYVDLLETRFTELYMFAQSKDSLDISDYRTRLKEPMSVAGDERGNGEVDEEGYLSEVESSPFDVMAGGRKKGTKRTKRGKESEEDDHLLDLSSDEDMEGEVDEDEDEDEYDEDDDSDDDEEDDYGNDCVDEDEEKEVSKTIKDVIEKTGIKRRRRRYAKGKYYIMTESAYEILAAHFCLMHKSLYIHSLFPIDVGEEAQEVIDFVYSVKGRAIAADFKQHMLVYSDRFKADAYDVFFEKNYLSLSCRPSEVDRYIRESKTAIRKRQGTSNRMEPDRILSERDIAIYNRYITASKKSLHETLKQSTEPGNRIERYELALAYLSIVNKVFSSSRNLDFGDYVYYRNMIINSVDPLMSNNRAIFASEVPLLIQTFNDFSVVYKKKRIDFNGDFVSTFVAWAWIIIKKHDRVLGSTKLDDIFETLFGKTWYKTFGVEHELSSNNVAIGKVVKGIRGLVTRKVYTV